MELTRYVGDRLHDLLGISDKYVAEYFIGLAGKSTSADGFVQKLKDTDTVAVDDGMVAFAQELWNKVSNCIVSCSPRNLGFKVLFSVLVSLTITKKVSSYRVQQKSSPLRFFWVFLAIAWDFKVEFYQHKYFVCK